MNNNNEVSAFHAAVAKEELVLSGICSAYEHKLVKAGQDIPKLAENTLPAVRKAWVLDAQWSDCPVEIEKIVRQLWRLNELGNDRYLLKMSIDDMEEGHDEGDTSEVWKGMPDGWQQEKIDYVKLAAYLRSKGVADDDVVWFHWWW
jgi:hypothetical protein